MFSLNINRDDAHYATGTRYALARMEVTCHFVNRCILVHPLMKGEVVKPPFE